MSFSLSFKHPDFRFQNDIALARLKTPTKVKPLELASNTSEDFAGMNCTIVGWGHRVGKQLYNTSKPLSSKSQISLATLLPVCSSGFLQMLIFKVGATTKFRKLSEQCTPASVVRLLYRQVFCTGHYRGRCIFLVFLNGGGGEITVQTFPKTRP